MYYSHARSGRILGTGLPCIVLQWLALSGPCLVLAGRRMGGGVGRGAGWVTWLGVGRSVRTPMCLFGGMYFGDIRLHRDSHWHLLVSWLLLVSCRWLVVRYMMADIGPRSVLHCP